MNYLKYELLVILMLLAITVNGQKIQGRAVYVSKSKLDLGKWGVGKSEAQKKQIANRLKNRLEKTYILSFNNFESLFIEDEKIDAISGATDSWGTYFSRGKQYKNVLNNILIQNQEFYGKHFLIKDKLYKIDWTLGTETKKIGNYTCYKAKAFVPKEELDWYIFSWSNLRKKEKSENNPDFKNNLQVIEAWYTTRIPIAQGPAEYFGLPGLILEVRRGNTVLLCTEIIINSKDKTKITVPYKGKEITKKEYAKIIEKKMVEMRESRKRMKSRI